MKPFTRHRQRAKQRVREKIAHEFSRKRQHINAALVLYFAAYHLAETKSYELVRLIR